MSAPFEYVHVIINPAAGVDEPILNPLNQVFSKYDLNWQVSITRKRGDAVRLTQKALADGADLIAGYGGDGTLREIANGLKDSQVPMAILPGGTGNGIARDLNIPMDLKKAAELICENPVIRSIDVGLVGEERFLLHVLSGLSTDQMANRELKNSLSGFAYILSALRVVGEPQLAEYSLRVDGKEIEEEGIVCIITNAYGLGVHLPLSEDIDISDGLLDVMLIKPEALSVTNLLLAIKDIGTLVHRWHGREISMSARPPQSLWVDGDSLGETPVDARILPKALRVVTSK